MGEADKGGWLVGERLPPQRGQHRGREEVPADPQGGVPNPLRGRAAHDGHGTRVQAPRRF